jgi:hypothetical protein
LLFRFAEFSQIQAKGVLAVMNRTVKLYQSVKRNKDWGTEPVPDNQLKNLKDLCEGQGNFYLAYYEGTNRRMAPVGRFADAAKQKLMRKRGELEMGLEPATPDDPGPKAESSIEAAIKKFVEQQEAFVGESGYGTAPPYRQSLPQAVGILPPFLRREEDHGREGRRLRPPHGVCGLAPQANQEQWEEDWGPLHAQHLLHALYGREVFPPRVSLSTMEKRIFGSSPVKRYTG